MKWTLKYPKGNDLIWAKSTKHGKIEVKEMPYINSDITEYNTKNVNSHRGTLEAFL